MSPEKRICVFCGSKTGSDTDYADAARALGTEIGRRGHGLVYGAGNIGLLGIIADEVLEQGAHVTGVIPESMVKVGLEHNEIHDLRVVKTMHERKALMVKLSNAFVAMPGGLGTFEELLEAFTWLQLGIHRKPVAILNSKGYYDALLGLFSRAVEDGFLAPFYPDALIVESDPKTLVDRIDSYTHPAAVQTKLEWEDL